MFLTGEVASYQKNALVVEIFYGKMSYQKLEEYLPYDGFDALGKVSLIIFTTSTKFDNRASILVFASKQYCVLLLKLASNLASRVSPSRRGKIWVKSNRVSHYRILKIKGFSGQIKDQISYL